MQKQPEGDQHLGRLAEPHLVGQQGGVTRHEERDALDLIGIGLKRQLHLPADEQIFQRRL